MDLEQMALQSGWNPLTIGFGIWVLVIAWMMFWPDKRA